ncbi:helix-turn-helix domain-containing protein [Lentzea sp. JNUCC 0626]|uniref:helix-turn-helix domain-containing protein n=1 Tax=Lentzea sp. JNUCC 0626 TaxID=3367513 RepID=UPI00374A4FD8
MSIEAISWALNDAPIPRDRRDASSLAAVLIGLANHAGPDGRNAFPSLDTLVHYTRLSERTVRYALRTLEELVLIRPSDPDIVAAYIKRADRRPKGYDLALRPFHRAVDNFADEGQAVPPVDPHEGQTPQERGANRPATRGNSCPRTVPNRPENRPASELRRPCGQCDARPGDPISARLVWLDEQKSRSVLCPRCHPRGTHTTGAHP